MGQLDNRAENSGSGEAQAAQAALNAVTHELKNLQQNLIVQMAQDIARLQAEKAHLIEDIERLRSHHQELYSKSLETASKQQTAQQQLWAKQLAQALANHLQTVLIQRLEQLSEDTRQRSLQYPYAGSSLPADSSRGYNDKAYQLLNTLDSTFSATFKSLQQELNSYQSSLSQQLDRMHSLEQQGEAILEALVERLNSQLQAQAAHPTLVDTAPPPVSVPASPLQTQPNPQGTTSATSPQTSIPLSIPTAPLPLQPQSQGLSQMQMGLLFVLLSTIALSVHNVIVRIIGTESLILGQWPLGGFISLRFLGNSLLILWLRMLIVLPLMGILARLLYPAVWSDIRKLLQLRDRRPLLNVVGSGGFLFLSQVLIYIAIGQIGPGVAVTILFMYPLVTVPLAWLLFGDRPSSLRIGVMGAISLGVVLAALPSLMSSSNVSFLGVGTAVISGIAFAFYLIFMQLGFKRTHPVPVSLIQFATIFVLASLSLILPLPLGVQVLAENRAGLVVGGVVLGVLTLAGYLLNNFGVRFMGAARASIVASSGPVLTALLAFLIIPGPQTALKTVQILGILLVTLGVTALSFERMLSQTKPAKS